MTDHVIDLEPKWADLLRYFLDNPKNYDILKPCAETMDTIRQAQKEGKKRVIFEFVNNKETNIIIED